MIGQQYDGLQLKEKFTNLDHPMINCLNSYKNKLKFNIYNRGQSETKLVLIGQKYTNEDAISQINHFQNCVLQFLDNCESSDEVQ